MKKRSYHWINHVFNFLAVILGVYLAFYVNEKAQARQEGRERQLLIASLANDLKDDIEVYEKYQIPMNEEQQQRIASLAELLSSGDTTGLEALSSAMLQLENYVPTTSTYSSMKASGKLRLMEDLALAKELSGYYEATVVECRAKTEFQTAFFTEELLSWLMAHTDLLAFGMPEGQKKVVLRNKLIVYESIIDQKVEAYRMVVDRSKQLLDDLEARLSSP